MVTKLLQVAGVPFSQDRTVMQIRQQLAAFHQVERFEVQAIHENGQCSDIKTWSREQIENGLGWMRHKNAEGFNIYVRPAPLENKMCSPYGFVDDADAATVQRMEADGLHFTTLTESSPGNYQGWVKISKEPVTREELNRITLTIARKYDTDIGSADWRHYGRLAGFTNRKEKHRMENGQHPFVLLKRADPGVEAGPEILQAARDSIKSDAQLAEMRKTLRTAERVKVSRTNDSSPRDAFTTAFNNAKSDNSSDRDFSACLSMFRAGYSREEVMAALIECSPDLAERHKNLENYVYTTVVKAKAQIDATPSRKRRDDPVQYTGPRR